MSSTLDKVLDYKESYEEKQQELARAEGALKQMTKNLRSHRCHNLQEGTDKLNELKTTLNKLNAQLESKLKLFEKCFGNKLNAD